MCRGRCRSCPIRTAMFPTAATSASPAPDGFKLEQYSVGYEFEHRFDNNLQFRQNFRYFDVDNNLAATAQRRHAERSAGRAHLQLCCAAREQLHARQPVAGGFRNRPAGPQGSGRLRLLQSSADTDYRITLGSRRSTPMRRSTVRPFRRCLLPPFICARQASQAGLYFQDQIKLDRWTLTLSGRQDWASTGLRQQSRSFRRRGPTAAINRRRPAESA